MHTPNRISTGRKKPRRYFAPTEIGALTPSNYISVTGMITPATFSEMKTENSEADRK